MRNRLKQQLKKGQVVVGAQLRFGSPAIAELFGEAGFDFLVIDCEHAAQDPPGIQAQLQAIAATQATPLVRVGQCDPDLVRLYLDLGAGGIVAPMISTAAQAEAMVKACRYFPAGIRSAGASRAARYGFDKEYFQNSNDNVMFIPIIETAESIQNIDQIFAVEGVDSYIMGPVDLSIQLGEPWQTNHPIVQDACRKTLDAAKNRGIPAGCGACGEAATIEEIRQQIDQGYRMFWVSGDEWILSGACRTITSGFARLLSERTV